MTSSPILNAFIFTFLGVVAFVLALSAVAKLAPFDLRKEIAERNVAAAILAGSMILAIAWIVAATMH